MKTGLTGPSLLIECLLQYRKTRLIRHQKVVIESSTVQWIGPAHQKPLQALPTEKRNVLYTIMPELVDHLAIGSLPADGMCLYLLRRR